MKGFLIGPDNERFEAEIVRYFQNVNDHYLIYTKNEKDANGYVLLYLTKVVSDNGIKVGENVTDVNEWDLIKSFLQKTVSENKEGLPLSIEDNNPAEIADLKINSQRPFKLSENSVELFGKNKKNFDIVQKMMEEQNTVKVPVAPEISEFVTEESKNESTFDNTFSFETQVNQDTVVPEETANKLDESSELYNTNLETSQQVSEMTTPLTESAVTNETAEPELNNNLSDETNEQADNYEELYKQQLEKMENLNKEIEQLKKENEEYKDKLNKLRELLG